MRQHLQRLAIVVTLVLAGLGLPAAANASATMPDDCAFSYHYPSALYNDMSWSTSDRNAWHTPMMRAGACGKVYIEFLGVYNAPACAYIKLVTYNENRERQYVGPWYLFEGIGRLGNIRGDGYISNGRLFRVYSYGCGRFRGPNWPTGFDIYTHGL